MPYYENVPQVGQQINTSRPQIQANFQTIQTALGRNHVTFTAAEPNWGKHNLAEFVRQAVDHDPAANNINVYCKNYAPSGKSELFLKRTGATAKPFTAASAYTQSSVVAATKNWVMLSENLVLVYGQAATAGGAYTAVDIRASAALPFTARPYTFTTLGNKDYNIADVPIYNAPYTALSDNNTLQVYYPFGNTIFTWIAIGTV